MPTTTIDSDRERQSSLRSAASFWWQKPVLVTGGAGFLGSHVVETLQDRGCQEVLVRRSRQYELRDSMAVARLFHDTSPDIVIHLAAIVGGTGANRERPGEFFYDNLIMGAQVMEQAWLFGVQKFVAVGTVCAYPKFTAVPFREDNLWDGYPEETNAPYGLAKKMLLVQAQAYRQQCCFNAIYLLPVNLYGPRDNFDPTRSHVIPALLKKWFDALDNDEDEIVVWGDGSPTREFLYVEDCAKAVVLATERYDKPDRVNIGTGFEEALRRTIEWYRGYRREQEGNDEPEKRMVKRDSEDMLARGRPS